MADRLVLSKTDLLTAGGGALRDLCARLKELNPGAVLLDAAKGEATAGGASRRPASTIRTENSRRAALVERGSFAARGADDIPTMSRHPHDDARQGEGKKRREPARRPHSAFCMRREAPAAPAAFDLFLELLRKRTGPGSCASRASSRWRTIPRGRSSSRASSMFFIRPVRLPAASGLTPITSTRMVFILRRTGTVLHRNLVAGFADSASPTPGDAALAQSPGSNQRRCLFS